MDNQDEKVFTGHKEMRMPDGRTLVEWITDTVKEDCKYYNVEMPSPKQMAVVIRAIRMHYIMEYASNYDRSELGDPDKLTTYWPVESSIGRYLRDAPLLTLEGDE